MYDDDNSQAGELFGVILDSAALKMMNNRSIPLMATSKMVGDNNTIRITINNIFFKCRCSVA